MTAMRWKALIVAAVLLGAAVLGRWATPTVHLADQQDKLDLSVAFPETVGDWRIDRSIPLTIVSPDMQAVIDQIYSQTLSRNYINSRGQRLMLSVAYGGDQSDATRAHRPEVCYPAQGFNVRDGRRAQVSLPGRGELPVQRLVAQLNSRIEPMTFWFVVGHDVAVSSTDQKLAQLHYGLRGLVPDGILVRVSTIHPDVDEAYRLHDDFIIALNRAVPARYIDRVLGDGTPFRFQRQTP